MTANVRTVLCVGATGSVGRHVVEEALRQGHAVRVLVRDRGRAAGLPARADIVVGDLTRPETLARAVACVGAIVFTHGSNGGKADTRAIDYGGVRNVLFALRAQKARIALMTAIGVTDRVGSHNRRTEAHDWNGLALPGGARGHNTCVDRIAPEAKRAAGVWARQSWESAARSTSTAEVRQ